MINADEIAHGKMTTIYHDDDPLFKKIPSPFKGGRYHSLIVDKKTLTSDLLLIAENRDGIVMGIKHKVYPCYGIQFHPESILTPEGDRCLINFLKSTFLQKQVFRRSMTTIPPAEFSLSLE